MLSTPLSLVVTFVAYRWISGCRFKESLWHCTVVFSVWFSRNSSLSDPDNWGEVSFNGDVYDYTSFLRWKSGVWVQLKILLVVLLWISIRWVSWCCCQTTSGIGGTLVVSRLSVSAPEWRRGFLVGILVCSLSSFTWFTLIGFFWTSFCLSGLLCPGGGLLAASAL